MNTSGSHRHRYHPATDGCVHSKHMDVRVDVGQSDVNWPQPVSGHGPVATCCERRRTFMFCNSVVQLATAGRPEATCDQAREIVC